MSHRFFTVLLTGCVVAAGCSGNKPPPAAVAPEGKASSVPAGPPAKADPATAPAAGAGSAATESSAPPLGPTALPLRDLAKRLIDGDSRGGWRINERAATELESQGPAGVAQLWPLLADPQVEVRRGAAFYLMSQVDPAESRQAAAFVGLLADSDRTIRNIALSTIKQLRREEQIAELPKLAAMLSPGTEDNADNRATVARLVGSLKTDASPAAAALQTAALSDPDAKVRAAALAAMTQVALPAEAVRTLAKGLQDRDAPVRLVAAARMRQLGPGAAPAVNELAAALGDSDASVSEAAAEALLRIGAAAVGPLAEQLGAGNLAARKLALACLAKLGPAAKPAAAAIEKCRQDPDAQVRQLAEVALQRISGK